MSLRSVSTATPLLQPAAHLQSQLVSTSPDALTHKVVQLLRHIPIDQTKTQLQQQFRAITTEQLQSVVTDLLEEVCTSTVPLQKVN